MYVIFNWIDASFLSSVLLLMIKWSHNIVNILYFQTNFGKSKSQQGYCKLTKIWMLVWVWRFILTESGTIGQFACHTGKCVNELEQRTTVVPANFIGYRQEPIIGSWYRISSFKFPLGLIVSVSFSKQYCQFHLWYRTGYRTTNVKPPFFNKPPPFSGEKNY